MKDKLSENIRSYRKERGFTQEQLAEKLDVSPGVISKWELGLSTPEIGILLELADFFEISVDVLLGYQMQDKNRALLIDELKRYIHDKRTDVPFDKVESTLKKYPHDFSIVYHIAELYAVKGVESRNRDYRLRALALYEQSCQLFSQNTDPEISLVSIRLGMARIYHSLGQGENAVKLLQENNPCGIHNALIGDILAADGKTKDAVGYLSQAMLQILSNQICMADGYVNAYINTGRYRDVIEVVHWLDAIVTATRLPEKMCFADKIMPAYFAAAAYAHWKLGDMDATKTELHHAIMCAQKFDAAPTYVANQVRFVAVDVATAYDDFGATAMDGLNRIVQEQNEPNFSALWDEVRQDETASNTSDTTGG